MSCEIKSIVFKTKILTCLLLCSSFGTEIELTQKTEFTIAYFVILKVFKR